MDQRKKKQILIAVIFFAIIGGAGFGLFRTVFPPQPTPTPDPRANLAPLQIVTSKFINVDEGEGNFEYDFVAKIRNSNTNFGGANVEYQIDFTDAFGSQLQSKRGTFYILPGQTKYIVDTPLRFSTQVDKAEMKIRTVDWRQLSALSFEGIDLIVKNTSYIESPRTGVFSAGSGLISNDSDFDFDMVDVVVVAQDLSGEVLAAGKTDIRTFLSHTQRGFEVAWFRPFVGQVARVEAESNTNVFNNLNFLRIYGGSERFQRLY